jgi:MinD superfamily P-loop ATPase
VKNHEGITIFDCPPGAWCSVIAAIEPADVVIAVVEPTPSGLHDFEILDDVLRELGKRCVTVINRDDAAGIQAVERCRKRNREPLAIIPFRKEFAADLLAGRYPQDLLKIMDEIFVKVAGHA